MGENLQATKMKGIGLKAKTLLGLSALLLVAIAGILIFTNLLLINDKKAYVFENVLSNAEKVRNLINENISNSLFQAESLAMLSQNENQNLKELMDRQELVDGLYFSFTGDSNRKTLMKSTFPRNSESYFDFVSNWIEDAKPTNVLGVSVKKIPSKNTFELNYRDDQKHLGLLINMDNVWTQISNDSVFSYTVVDKNRKPLWTSGENLNDFPYEELIQASGASTSKEVTINEGKYLVAVSSLPKLGIYVISYISTAKAYAVVGDLSVKTISFGLVLLGVSLILGLWFAKRLTGPIEALMEGANFVAEGNFDHEVEVRTHDELAVLGGRFNFMSGKIKDLLGEKEIIIDELKEANIKIEDYFKNLEKKVEERTRELKSANDFIQAMIDSLDQGLFVFGPDLKCSPVYTKACENLFRKSPAGLTYNEVLDVPADQNARIEKWANIMFSEKLPFESAATLGVNEKVYGESIESDDYSMLKLHYHPMRDEEEKISNVVVVATDKTDEMRAIEETRKKERYVEMIFKILATKKQFIEFIGEVDSYVKSLDEVIEAPQPSYDHAMLIYHSFNGGFGMYAVDALVTEARKCEQTVVDMKKKGVLDHQLLIDQKNAFKESYHRFKQETFDTLGFNSNTVEIDQAILLYINDLVQQTDNRELKHVFNEKIMKVPVEEFFVPYKKLLESLGPKLGKEFAPLVVHNGDLRVDPDSYREFFSLLVHLFRNCADHGIEAPHVREERNKTMEGNIQVHVGVEGEGSRLKLVVEDDGNGIDPARVRKKLQENNPDKSYTDETDQDIIYHIFDQDFSTAEQVTTISGRGVGMSAIKDIVDRMNGQIKLESEVGKGTKFIFDLPISY
ncbi:ATP-binding protein [Peredibacter starrii]|uniref:histidine kinase n=1 Tax=Peredibacter starrii TaxID=28202 RepID=A0AAX4HU85_9BACT|nr:ATP-binding protein [Peredibacter starrii]WPU66776.1 ATP-binding protein [Peredibacter starrii]